MSLIIGTVKDEQGSSVPSALVAVEWGTEPYPDLAIYTDSEGNFSIDLPIGRFRLAAHSPNGGYGTVEYDSDTSKHILIRLNTRKLKKCDN